jgi:hypothetical protein
MPSSAFNRPPMPIYNKAGEEIFDLNNPDQVEEAGNLVMKRHKIPFYVAEIEREFHCAKVGHHGVCWVAPASAGPGEAGRHFQMDDTLKWSMAKLLVRLSSALPLTMH